VTMIPILESLFIPQTVINSCKVSAKSLRNRTKTRVTQETSLSLRMMTRVTISGCQSIMNRILKKRTVTKISRSKLRTKSSLRFTRARVLKSQSWKKKKKRWWLLKINRLSPNSSLCRAKKP
jgi:hypothetical protein